MAGRCPNAASGAGGGGWGTGAQSRPRPGPVDVSQSGVWPCLSQRNPHRCLGELNSRPRPGTWTPRMFSLTSGSDLSSLVGELAGCRKLSGLEGQDSRGGTSVWVCTCPGSIVHTCAGTCGRACGVGGSLQGARPCTLPACAWGWQASFVFSQLQYCASLCFSTRVPETSASFLRATGLNRAGHSGGRPVFVGSYLLMVCASWSLSEEGGRGDVRPRSHGSSASLPVL